MIAVRTLCYWFVITSIFQSSLFAQSGGSLQIRLQESNQHAVIGATMQLTDRAYTTRKLYALSDTTGSAVFSIRTGRSYRLVVTSVGYKPLRKESLPVLGQLVLTPDNVQLQAVSVSVAKPLVRQKDDKTIVDPEPIAATSTSAYELPGKTPDQRTGAKK